MAHRLRWNVRRRLAYGVLPELDGQAWPGPATGKPCIICNMQIVHPDIEYEVEIPKRTFAHAWCYTVWLEESRRFKR